MNDVIDLVLLDLNAVESCQPFPTCGIMCKERKQYISVLHKEVQSARKSITPLLTCQTRISQHRSYH